MPYKDRDVQFPEDIACEKFKAKKHDTWELDLNLQVPKQLKPCGFFDDQIIESAWLPYKSDKGEVSLRPSLIIKNVNGELKVEDFYVQKDVRGTFPSQELKTLISINAVKSVLEKKEIEPKEVDNELDIMIQKHAELGNKRRIVLKRWIEGTYFHDIFDHFPILNVMGVSESGKSRILKIVNAVCYHGDSLIDPTEAVIFRSKEEDHLTLCWDEAEYLNIPNINQVIRTLINSSYSKGSYVVRYDEIGGKRVKRTFDLYSPMAIVGISGLYGVTSSRAIQIITERANKDFPVAKIEDYGTLRDKLYILRFSKAFELKEIYDKLDVSNIVTARFEELFKPLFALTKIFGTQDEYDALNSWAKMYQDTYRAEALNIAEEEQILSSLSQLTPLPDDWYLIKELTEMVNVTYARHLGYQKVSQILRRIGIVERRRVKGVTQFRVDRQTLETVVKRLGLELPEKVEKITQPKIFLNMLVKDLIALVLGREVERV